MRIASLLGPVATLATLAVAASSATELLSLSKRCINSPENRACWGDYDISTNYYETGPDTGVVREYWFDVVNTTLAPDGVERQVLCVNGTIPGPTIIADWGDTVSTTLPFFPPSVCDDK